MSFDPQGLGEARSETGWVCIRNVVPGETRRTERHAAHFGHTCREKYGAAICRLQGQLLNKSEL